MYLICDMDGTLLKNDFFEELFFKKLLETPFSLIKYLFKKDGLLLLKQDLLNGFQPNYPIDFLLNHEVLNFINEKKGDYKGIILVTASPDKFANQLFGDLDLFTGIFGSTNINLKGIKKLDFILEKEFTPFTYIGNDSSDKIIYQSSLNPLHVINGKLKQVENHV